MQCADVEVVAQGLWKCSALRELHIRNNNIKAPGVGSMATALAGACESLHTLDLSHNKLRDEGAERLAGALHGCTSLTSLTLRNIYSGSRGLKALGKVPQECGSLRRLDLMGNEENTGAQVHVVAVSERGAHLTHLDLGSSTLAFRILQQVVSLHACTLVHLNLERAGIRLLEAQALAQALEHCGVLEHLNLYYNDQLDDDGVRALAGGLAHCTALRDLNLRKCNVQEAECSALAQGLRECTALTKLNLANNDLGQAGAHSLARALPRCTALTELNLSSTNIRANGTTALSEMLYSCPALVYVHFGSCCA